MICDKIKSIVEEKPFSNIPTTPYFLEDLKLYTQETYSIWKINK